MLEKKQKEIELIKKKQFEPIIMEVSGLNDKKLSLYQHGAFIFTVE